MDLTYQLGNSLLEVHQHRNANPLNKTGVRKRGQSNREN